MTRIAAFGIAAGFLTLSIFCAGGGVTNASSGSRVPRLKGRYSGIFSGQANTGNGFLPLAGTGIFIADGRGNLSGHETYTIDTTVCEAEISGSYTISADGTGTGTVAFISSSDGCTSGSYTQSLAIAKHGALVLLSNTNGDQINEEWYLQN